MCPHRLNPVGTEKKVAKRRTLNHAVVLRQLRPLDFILKISMWSIICTLFLLTANKKYSTPGRHFHLYGISGYPRLFWLWRSSRLAVGGGGCRGLPDLRQQQGLSAPPSAPVQHFDAGWLFFPSHRRTAVQNTASSSAAPQTCKLRIHIRPAPLAGIDIRALSQICPRKPRYPTIRTRHRRSELRRPLQPQWRST